MANAMKNAMKAMTATQDEKEMEKTPSEVYGQGNWHCD